MIKNALNVQKRLMRHTEYNESSGCWEWFGSKRNGYGRMIIGSRTDGTRKMEFAKRPFKMPLVESTGLICHSRRKENDKKWV